MTVIHHSAVAAAWTMPEDAEYHPFSGYGGYHSDYGRAAPWRGHSTIPHHVAVESREDGERNGRIFYVSATTAERQQTQRLRRPTVFRMDARHSAIAGPPPEEVLVIRLPDAAPLPPRATRAKPHESVRRSSEELVGAF